MNEISIISALDNEIRAEFLRLAKKKKLNDMVVQDLFELYVLNGKEPPELGLPSIKSEMQLQYDYNLNHRESLSVEEKEELASKVLSCVKALKKPLKSLLKKHFENLGKVSFLVEEPDEDWTIFATIKLEWEAL